MIDGKCQARYVIFRCAEIDRQVQEIQAKRRKLNDSATQQEKVYVKKMKIFLLNLKKFYEMLHLSRLRLVRWVTMTI